MKLRKIWKHRWSIAIVALILWIAWWYHEGKQRQHDAVIIAAGQRYGVDPALVKAVVWRESRFDPHAHGNAGEIGLMQVMPGTASEWADAEKVHLYRLEDPATNTRAGTWYLAKTLRRYRNTDDPIVYALADYNAGRKHVLRWAVGPAATNSAAFLARMDFPGTRKYIQSITDRYAYYKPNFPPPKQ